MYVGTQVAPRNDDDLRQWAQLGVNNICADPRNGNAHSWTQDDLASWREHVNSFGIELDMIQLPLSSTPIERAEAPAIMLGVDPDRDREIDVVNNLIENCAAVGIPAVKYNMNLIGIPRSEREPGRGGSSNSTMRFEKIKDDNAPGIAGEVSEDEFWERIDYFLERVVPVAAENKVRLACHPHDPYTPPGFRGVTRVLGTPDGLEKVRRHAREPLPRPQLLPGYRHRDARRPRRGDLRHHPLLRIPGEDLQRPLPKHPRPQARLHGGLPRRRLHQHVRVHQGLPRSRLQIHAHARPRPPHRRRRPPRHRIRLRIRLHHRPPPGHRRTPKTTLGDQRNHNRPPRQPDKQTESQTEPNTHGKLFDLGNEYTLALIIAGVTVAVAAILEIAIKIAKNRIRAGVEDFVPGPKFLVLEAIDGPAILIILLIGGTYSGSLALQHWQTTGGIDANITVLVQRAGTVAAIATGAFLATRIGSLLFDWYATHVAATTSTSLDDQLIPSFKRMLPILIYALAILWSLAVFEIQISPLLATLGIGGIAIALAAQPTLSNYFAGTYVISEGEIQVGDFIEIEGGPSGFVEDISWRSTKLRSRFNNLIIIPNSMMSDNMITNYSRPALAMNVIVTGGVSYSSDLQQVEDMLMEVASKVVLESEHAITEIEPWVGIR